MHEVNLQGGFAGVQLTSGSACHPTASFPPSTFLFPPPSAGRSPRTAPQPPSPPSCARLRSPPAPLGAGS